jgi:Protein of unknown function (DUF3108).
MKKRILIATTFLMSLMTGSGSFHALAQNEPYALVKVGASEEFATRNAKGAVTDYQLVKVTGNGKDGDTLIVVDGKINMHVNNYGRKVLGRETITTSAGTFDCVVLEEYLSLNVLVISEKTRKKTWYAPGIGEIRTEVWNKGRKSGAPDSVMTLTRLQK